MNTEKTYLVFTARVFCFLFCSVFLVVALISCNDDDIKPVIPIATESSIADVIEAMGGESVINGMTHISYQVSGTSYEHEEEEPGHMDLLVTNNYSYKVTSELLKRSIRMDYTKLDSNFPFEFNSPGATIIVKDKVGTISGQYDLPSVYFGLGAAQGLHAPRIETLLKNYAMGNTAELIKRLIEINSDLDTKTTDNIFSLPTLVSGLDIKLHIDLETHLPTKATIQEADFLHGDVAYEVSFSDWDVSSSFRYPTKLKHTYNGELHKDELVTSVNLNPTITDDYLDPEPIDNNVFYDPDFAPKGVMHSQWYDRFFNLGFVIDIPLTAGFVMKDQWVAAGLPDQTIGDNVKIIGHPNVSYWAVAIKTDDGVLVVEAPLNQEWTASIIDAIKSDAGFPNEPIIGVIPTHTHVDHFGGIRELAAESGMVYMHSEGRSTLESVLNSTHGILADKLSKTNKDISITSVDNILKLDNGKVEIHPVDLEGTDNPHSENMLLVYVPEYELLIQADLFNAGAFVALYAGQGAQPMSDETKASWRSRARFLNLYIEQNNLKVSKIMGVHGGIAPLEQLQFVAQ